MGILIKIEMFEGAALPRGSILASHPAAPDSIPSIPQKFSKEKNIDVAEVNQRHWLKESGYWLDKADQTLLVLTSCQHYFTKRINVLAKESFHRLC